MKKNLKSRNTKWGFHCILHNYLCKPIKALSIMSLTGPFLCFQILEIRLRITNNILMIHCKGKVMTSVLTLLDCSDKYSLTASYNSLEVQQRTILPEALPSKTYISGRCCQIPGGSNQLQNFVALGPRPYYWTLPLAT